MIRTLRAYFLGRLLRERILLVGLLVVVAVLWLSNFFGRLSHFTDETHHTTYSLKQQAHWLGSRERVEKATRDAAARFDPAQTLDGTRLLAAISAMANDAGLKNYSTGDEQDVSNGQFSVHTLQFTVTKVDWGTLGSFYNALQKRAPYIGIEQFAVMADRANPALLNLTMKISSVEVAHNP